MSSLASPFRGAAAILVAPLGRWSAGITALMLAVTGPVSSQEIDTADLVVTNARIITVDANHRITQALAVRQGRLVAVGSDSEIARFTGPQTEVLDAEGRTVLPGLIDSHTHPLGAAMIEFDHEIPEMLGIDDVLAYVRERARVLDPDTWIVLQQVFITRLREKRYPTRAELDAAAPDHPVIFRTGPDASLNSLALSRLHLTRDSAVPAGAKLERDGSGEPSGIVRGWSHLTDLPEDAGQEPAREAHLERLRLLFADYNAVGLTGVIDRNASSRALGLYEDLLQAGQLPLRLAMSRGVSNQGSAEEIEERIAAIAAEPRTRNRDPRLRTVGIKMFLDGGMLTGSAYLRQPWGTSDLYGISDPQYRGLRFLDQPTLEAAIQACAHHRLQFTAHSVGDGAVHALLDAFETAGPQLKETRPNITHANFLSLEALDKMAALGVSADIQPAWLYLDAATLNGHFGQERLRYFQPWKTLFSKNVIAGGGSDHMQKIGALRSVNPYHPFLGMWVTMTRQARGLQEPLHLEEALDRMQALRLYTINNAYLMFQEDEIGSLEVGKRADFILIDRDYLTCPLSQVRRIEVLGTWVDGRPVYRQP